MNTHISDKMISNIQVPDNFDMLGGFSRNHIQKMQSLQLCAKEVCPNVDILTVWNIATFSEGGI
jgi:hypothetical protein